MKVPVGKRQFALRYERGDHEARRHGEPAVEGGRGGERGNEAVDGEAHGKRYAE